MDSINSVAEAADSEVLGDADDADEPVPPVRTPDDEELLIKRFPGATWYEPSGQKKSWVYKYGYNIWNPDTQMPSTWVCLPCIQLKKVKPSHCVTKNLCNAENHLEKKHRILGPKKRREAKLLKRRQGTPSIRNTIQAQISGVQKQQVVNHMVASFDREVFQRLNMAWMIEDNIPFRAAESRGLRELLDYCNPNIAIQKAHLTANAIRDLAIAEYNKHKSTISKKLLDSGGKIHLAFDGWKAGKRKHLVGIVATYQGLEGRPEKVVLGMPELGGRQTGEVIPNVFSFISLLMAG
jgi:hypothetical protein